MTSPPRILPGAIVLIIVCCLAPLYCLTAQVGAKTQGAILHDVPQEADANARYLFYLHGYIVESKNTRPVSPKFGAYEYASILETFKESGFVVISEARTKSREIEPYARKVADQVRQLLKAGVPAKHITVVGASQGSWIAMLVSTYLENCGVNFVLIAACSADKEFLKMVNLHGNILSIYESSDLAQSCRDYRADATGINDWKEVEINTGLKHGFLYRPMKEWIEPTITWAKRKFSPAHILSSYWRFSRSLRSLLERRSRSGRPSATCGEKFWTEYARSKREEEDERELKRNRISFVCG